MLEVKFHIVEIGVGVGVKGLCNEILEEGFLCSVFLE